MAISSIIAITIKEVNFKFMPDDFIMPVQKLIVVRSFSFESAKAAIKLNYIAFDLIQYYH